MGVFESFAEKIKKVGKKTEETELTFKPYEEISLKSEPAVEELYEESVSKKSSAAMVANSEQDSNIEFKIVRPADFSEVSDIADYLIRGCTVVLNTEVLEMNDIIRMLDFLNGVTYTTGGEIKNINNTTFIITPHNVDVSDDE